MLLSGTFVSVSRLGESLDFLCGLCMSDVNIKATGKVLLVIYKFGCFFNFIGL